MTVEQRFMAKVIRSDTGCWQWIGCTSGATARGYVQFNGKPTIASRVSWALFRGPLPPGALVCHTCDNPNCVRPDHLFLGSVKDNADDAKNKRRHSHGERHGMAKLSADDVLWIRRTHADGLASTYKLAAMFGVTRTNIRLILQRKIWSHI